MNHIPEGTLQAFADGELSPSERQPVMRHLATCGSCTDELEAVRACASLFSGAIGLLDVPAPVTEVPSLPAGVIPLASRRRQFVRQEHGHGMLARAAGLVLATAVIASATIPGSPLRGWFWKTTTPKPTLVRPERPVAPPVTAPAIPAPVASRKDTLDADIAVASVAGEAHVRLVSPRSGTEIMVRLRDVAELGVRITGSARRPGLTTGNGYVEVRDAGPGQIEVVVPRSLAAATIQVGARPWFQKQGDQIHLLQPAADSTATEIRFEVP